MSPKTGLPEFLARYEAELVRNWVDQQRTEGFFAGGGESEKEIVDQSRRFLEEFRKGAASGQLDNVYTPVWANTRAMLDGLSRDRAQKGATPTQTASFIFSLKSPLFTLLRRDISDAARLADEILVSSQLLDKLGLYTTEAFQKSRDEIIARQQEEMLELSTPVVQLWDGILALPLIGTLDSARTQVVMETLLQEIVRSEAEIAIVDITGVPTVDTLVAQHLLRTISAARLMGADCIISGIRPQIAQTMVHLGVDLQVTSKATMADAFALALKRMGKTVADRGRLSTTPQAAPAPREES